MRPSSSSTRLPTSATSRSPKSRPWACTMRSKACTRNATTAEATPPSVAAMHTRRFLAEVAAVGQAGRRIEVREPAYGFLRGVQPRQVLQRDDHDATVRAARAFDELGLLVQPGRRAVRGLHAMVETKPAVAGRTGDERGPHDLPIGRVEERDELLVSIETRPPRGPAVHPPSGTRFSVRPSPVSSQWPTRAMRWASSSFDWLDRSSSRRSRSRSRKRTRSTRSRGFRPFWAKSLAPEA